MEQQQSTQQPQFVEDDFDRYLLDSAMLRVKLGFTSNRRTPEQKKLYNEEQRKLWLAINNPQKLKDEYGITEYSVTEPQS